MRFPASLTASAVLCLPLMFSSCGDRQEQAHQDLRREDYGFTAAEFLRAAGDGQGATINRFLDAGMNVNASDESGATALHRAAAKGHGHLVTLLLGRGADPRRTDSTGTTPLLAAARGGDPSAVRALLKAGADAAVRDTAGESALEAASLAGHAALIPDLAPVSGTSPDNALRLAAGAGHTSVMDALLVAGAEMNAADGDGVTPLMAAAAHGHEGPVKLLCHQGVDAGAKDRGGRTAAELAEAAGHPDIAHFLREWIGGGAKENGVAVNSESTGGNTDAPPEAPAGEGEGPDASPSPALAADVTAPPPDPAPGLLAGARLEEPQLENMSAVSAIMTMEGYLPRQFPVILLDVEKGHGTASVRVLGPEPGKETIRSFKAGDSLPGTGCVVEKLRRRHLYRDGNENGELMNVSFMTMHNPATGERFQAMRDAPVFSNEKTARVKLAGRQGLWEARKGDEFRVGSTLLKIAQIEESRIVVENRLTGETAEVPRVSVPATQPPARTP